MNQVQTTANYGMSQGDLLLTSLTKAELMRRDAAAFATRGVKPERLDAFEAQIAAAAKLPSDEQLDFEKQTLTDAVATQRARAQGSMAAVMSQVAIVHNERSPAYKAFGSAGLAADSLGDFYLNLGHLVDWATLHVGEYADQGLTLAQLQALSTENEQFLAALKAQRLAISRRSAATQTRQITLNALYNELSALCGIGQGLFKQTDVSKYDDYVIDAAPGTGTAPPAVQ